MFFFSLKSQEKSSIRLKLYAGNTPFGTIKNNEKWTQEVQLSNVFFQLCLRIYIWTDMFPRGSQFYFPKFKELASYLSFYRQSSWGRNGVDLENRVRSESQACRFCSKWRDVAVVAASSVFSSVKLSLNAYIQQVTVLGSCCFFC